MAKPQKHAHRYLRVKLGKKGFEVFKCVKPGCGHYIRSELVIGQVAECWRCGAEFTMTQKQIQYKKPHCVHCVRPYNIKDLPAAPKVIVNPANITEMLRRVMGEKQ